MADERLDIIVTDKVDPSVGKKIEDIASAADRAGDFIGKLQRNLAAVNDSALARLANAMAKVDSAQARVISAQARLTNAQNAGSVAAGKLALNTQKIATEAARTEAAQQRASAATSAAESAAMRLASAQQRIAGAAVAAGSAENSLASTTDKTRAAFDRGEMSIRGYVNALKTMGPVGASANVAGQQLAGSLNSTSMAADRAARAGRMTTHTNANIIAQLQDIGVSLAGGQNPLLVAIQQGSQLSYIASVLEGGMKQLLGTIVALLAPFTLIVAAIGALYLGFKNFHNEIATRSKPEMEAYAKSLGLTDKEMKKLGNTSLDASGKLKEFDVTVVTMGDTWNGFKATVAEGFTGLVDGWGPVTDFFADSWDKVTKFLKLAFLGFYGLVVGGMRGIARVIGNLPSVVAANATAMANGAITAVEWMVNKAIDGINMLIGLSGPLLEQFGVKLNTMGHVQFGRFAKTGQTAIEIITEEVVAGVQEADRTLKGFAKRWEQNTLDAAKNRVAEAAKAIIENRADPKALKPKKDKTGKEEVDLLAQIIRGLNGELALMKLLKDERAIKSRMDGIEEQLLRKKIVLSEAERKSLQGMVEEIENYKIVQSESDKIMENVNGAQKTLTATITAANVLYDDAKISFSQYMEAMRMAERTFNLATDPLFAMNEAIVTAENVLGKYGVELEKANYLESVRQAMLAQGKGIYDENTGALKAEVVALIAKNDALRQQQFIQSQAGSFINPALEQAQFISNYQNLYSEIQRLRDSDLANEGAYQQALYGLQAKYNEMRLSGMSSFFGALASVTAKGHGAIGVISKAAAVAQATMDGYVAVQKALASLPPPFNFAAAAAVAMQTGVQVAGILSTNVGSFATGGQFTVAGKAGVDANNINMNVTKGERVTVETPAQQRAADNNGQGGGSNVSVPVRIINQLDPNITLDAVSTSEGEKVIVNVISRNASAIKRLLGA